MKFREWLQDSLLLEFRSSNFYDFYALELASQKMDSKEVEDLIIDRGNALYSDIMSALGFLLFIRYGSVFRQCASIKAMMLSADGRTINLLNKLRLSDFPDEIHDSVVKYMPIFDLANERPRIGWTATIDRNQAAYNSWLKLDANEQKELVYFARETLLSWEEDCNLQVVQTTFSDRWDTLYEYFINNVTSEVIINPAVVVRMINNLTQLVHNNGNILQYMPEELDKAIHIRDTATLSQLLYGASTPVKEILRSALLPSGGLVEELPPATPQLLLTAMSRSLDQHDDIDHIQLMQSKRTSQGETGIYKVHCKLGFWGQQQSDCTFDFTISTMKTRPQFRPQTHLDLDMNSIKNQILNKLTTNDWYNIKGYLRYSDSAITHRLLEPVGEGRLDYIQAGKLLLSYIDDVIKELNGLYHNMLRYGTWHRSNDDYEPDEPQEE